MRQIVALSASVGLCNACSHAATGCDTPGRGHWSQWRGADGSGVSAETGLPAEWSPESARWKTALPGRGHSSPDHLGQSDISHGGIAGPRDSGCESSEAHHERRGVQSIRTAWVQIAAIL